MAAIERLAAADHAAVGRLLLEAYVNYAERIGPVEWLRLQEGLVAAAGRLTDLPANFGLRYWRVRLDLAGGG